MGWEGGGGMEREDSQGGLLGEGGWGGGLVSGRGEGIG